MGDYEEKEKKKIIRGCINYFLSYLVNKLFKYLSMDAVNAQICVFSIFVKIIGLKHLEREREIKGDDI